MAIVKHIKSRNANYSAAINYLLFEHDEKTGKKIVDESGRSILRKEFCIWHRNTASKNWMRSIYCYRSDQRNHIP